VARSSSRDLVFIEDEAIRDDRREEWQHAPFSRTVAETAGRAGGPLTLGVVGPPGPSRASILRQAESILEEEWPRVATVTFNAWRHGRGGSFFLPLLASIAREVEAHAASRGKRTQDACWEIGRALRTIAWDLSSHRELLVEWNGHRYIGEKTIDLRSLHHQASETLTRLTARGPFQDGQAKVVVFVNDLDRCVAEGVLRLLEGIRRVLAQPGFVFVIAADESILRDAMGGRAGDALDNLVQRRLRIPESAWKYTAYLDDLISRSDVLRNAPELQRVLHQHELGQLLALESRHEPRSIVQFINNLLADGHLYAMATDGVREQLGVTLEEFFATVAVSRVLRDNLGPGVYETLVRDDELCAAIATKPRSHVDERVVGLLDAEAWNARRAVVEELSERPLLTDLLDSELGRTWLANTERRLAVEQFLVMPQRESSSVSRPGAAAIARAIWKTLGKADDEPVMSEELGGVRELHLAAETVVDADLVRLSDLTGLNRLFLSGCTGVTDAGLRHLVDLGELQLLALGGTGVTDRGLEHVAWLKQLAALYLADTDVSDAGLEQIAALKRLRILDLSNTAVSDAGLAHLAKLKRLQELRLNDTAVTDAALEQVATFKRLRTLALEATRVTDAGLAHLARLDQLRELILDGTHITDEGLRHIAGLTELRVLALSNTRVSDVGLQHLGAFEHLEELYLANTWVTDIELDRIPTLDQLEELDLERSMVTREGESWLHEKFPNCIIVR
jgi:hypothetical protein